MARLTPEIWWPLTWQQYVRLTADKKLPLQRIREAYNRELYDYQLLELWQAALNAKQQQMLAMKSKSIPVSVGDGAAPAFIGDDNYMVVDYVDDGYVE